VAPWLVSFIFLQGGAFALLLNWAALIFGSVVNFILPFVLYFLSTDRIRRPQSELVEWTPGVSEEMTLTPLVITQDVDPSDKTVHQALPAAMQRREVDIALRVLLFVFCIVLSAQIIFDIIEQAKGNSLLS